MWMRAPSPHPISGTAGPRTKHFKKAPFPTAEWRIRPSCGRRIVLHPGWCNTTMPSPHPSPLETQNAKRIKPPGRRISINVVRAIGRRYPDPDRAHFRLPEGQDGPVRPHDRPRLRQDECQPCQHGLLHAPSGLTRNGCRRQPGLQQKFDSRHPSRLQLISSCQAHAANIWKSQVGPDHARGVARIEEIIGSPAQWAPSLG